MSVAGANTAGAPSAGAGNNGGGPSAGATNTSAGSDSVAGSGNAGAGNSGGMPGGGGSGAGSGGASGGSGGTATVTGCAGLQLCDDFEGDAPGKGASPWKVNGGTALTVVTDQHNSGMHSVHIAAPDTGGFMANIQETKTFPAADFWGRAFLRFKAGAGGHQMYIAVNLPSAQNDQLRLLNRLGSDNAQVNFQKTDKFYDTGFKIPQETWFCYEWHVTTSAVNIWVDGTARTVTIPGITGGTALSLGFQRYAAGGGAGELWIDDVAVNDKQIGCK